MGIEFRLSVLAERIGAILQGEDAVVTGVASIGEAGPDQVTFLASHKFARLAIGTKASAIVARSRVEGSGAAFLLSDDPVLAFARLVELFHPPARRPSGISGSASVHQGARLGKDVSVAPFAVIEDGAAIGDRTVVFPGVFVGEGVSVGDDCVLHPNVVIYHGVRLGSRVILHAGCVIGADGFGYVPSPEGLRKIPQVGTVEIGDDVEIGANTAVDRAALGVTRIGRGTKIDNLVQVAHNVVIGTDTAIAAQAGISGSVRIGNRVMIGGQAGLAGHIEVEDGIMLGAKTGVAGTLKSSESRAWSGTPAIPHPAWLKMSALLPKIPDLFRRVRNLEERIKMKGEE